MPKMLRSVLAVIGLCVMLLVSLPSAATAQTPPVSPDRIDRLPNTVSYGCPPPESRSRLDKSHLPIDRWSGGAGEIHTRLGAKAWDDIDKKLIREWTGAKLLGFGHGIYGFGTSMVSFATRFDVLCVVAKDADGAAARLGGSVLSSGLITFMVVGGILVALWRSYRRQGGNAFAHLGKAALLVGILVVLVTGAENGASGGNPRGSPGWIAVQVDNTLSTIGGAPAQILLGSSADDPFVDVAETVDGAGSRNPLSCVTYTQDLRNRYRTAAARTNRNWESTIPLALSSLWEASGKAAWRDFQFGQNNDLGREVDCRLLEVLSGVPEAQQRQLLEAQVGAHASGLGPPGEGFFKVVGNTARDRWMVGWAACRWTGSGWVVSTEFRPVVDNKDNFGSGDIGNICSSWWGRGANDAESKEGNLPEGLNYNDDPSQNAKEMANAPEALDFLSHMHGDALGSALMISVTYIISALVMALAFGALSLALIISKIMVIVMIPLVILVLLASLWPSKTDADKTTKFLKFFIGASAFQLMFLFILGLVAIITTFVARAGIVASGEGTVLAAMWAGLSPVFAFVIVSILFKAVGLPSPLSPTSSLGYAAALAGTGAAVGAGVATLMNQGTGRARAYTRGRMGRMSTPGSGSLTPPGGTAGGRGGMGSGPTPTGAPPPSPSGSGTGGGTGSGTGGGTGSGTDGGTGSGTGGGTGSPPPGDSEPLGSAPEPTESQTSVASDEQEQAPEKRLDRYRRLRRELGTAGLAMAAGRYAAIRSVDFGARTTARGVQAGSRSLAQPFGMRQLGRNPRAASRVGRRAAMVAAGVMAIGSAPFSVPAVIGVYAAGRVGARLIRRPASRGADMLDRRAERRLERGGMAHSRYREQDERDARERQRAGCHRRQERG
jgi:hypothetical protein